MTEREAGKDTPKNCSVVDNPKLLPRLLLTMVVVLALMSGYQWAKELLFPTITIMQSDFLTILFTTIATTLFAYFGFRRFEAAQKRLLYQTTEAKAARESEETLKEQLLFLQNLLDAIPNPVFYKDTQGRYQNCNKALETFYGLKREEILGKPISDLTSEDLAEIHSERDATLLRHPGVAAYEAQFKVADGYHGKRHVLQGYGGEQRG